jgi:hypothetical protein
VICQPAWSGQTSIDFPVTEGVNLQRQRVLLPSGLQGDLNILIIAFQRWQQATIDSWVPFVEELEQTHSGMRYHELPTLERLDSLSRTLINEGMRAGIPDARSRQRTITLYVDRAAFRSALDLPDENTIYVLLVNRQGRVVWRAEGTLTGDKSQSLLGAIRTHQRASLDS